MSLLLKKHGVKINLAIVFLVVIKILLVICTYSNNISLISPSIKVVIDLVLGILIVCSVKNSNIRGKFWGILLMVIILFGLITQITDLLFIGPVDRFYYKSPNNSRELLVEIDRYTNLPGKRVNIYQKYGILFKKDVVIQELLIFGNPTIDVRWETNEIAHIIIENDSKKINIKVDLNSYY